MLAGFDFGRLVTGTSPVYFWSVFVFAVALSIKGLLVGIRRWQLARRLEDLPTSRIRSAAQGLTELVGRARPMPGNPMHAPLSHRASVWWSYRIQQVRDSSIDDLRIYLATFFFQKILDLFESFPVQDSGTSEHPFLLHDEHDICAVFPRESEVVFGHRDIWYGEGPEGCSPALGKLSMFSAYRYEEHRIEAGDLVYVIGHFRTEDADAAPWQEEVEIAERLRTWKSDYDGLLAQYDHDGNGQLDAREWALVRHAARREIRKDRAGRRSGITPHRILNGHDGHGMLIVVFNEHGLEFRLRCAAIGWLVVFLGLGAVCLMSFYLRMSA